MSVVWVAWSTYVCCTVIRREVIDRKKKDLLFVFYLGQRNFFLLR